MANLHHTLSDVTQRIRDRSSATRSAYLRRIEAAKQSGPLRGGLPCANLAHGFASAPANDKLVLREARRPSIAIVSAYNDMLSAHQPFERFPALIKQAARDAGAVAQFAGGVPAMCDGVTQGRPGMELSLFSRDVIALATAVALSHDMFDAALYLGVCDKIVPGLLIGALAFGHLPAIFVPAGPMVSGLSNDEKGRIRQLYAQGKVGRDALLESEASSYHSPGTCTFYGTANSNQMLMEVMGLHLPGSAFVNPGTPLRDALTQAAARRAAQLIAAGEEYTPVGRVIDERAIVNGMAGLLATGGSTNHTIHLVAIARAAGIIIDWDDFAALSGAIPLIARVYPNGKADVNHFHAAGGMGYLIGELLDHGLLHADVLTVAGAGGLARYREEPFLDGATLAWRRAPAASGDATVLSTVAAPFSADGGLKLLSGNLGRAVIKTSAVKPEHRVVEAPALVFHSQAAVEEAFARGELRRDFIAVLCDQGPRANGMPELHKLTPVLGVLQDEGYRVGLVTDGRMSGASGKVPAAIHVTPECASGGPLARVRDGDLIVLDSERGMLEARVPAAEWAARDTPPPDLSGNEYGIGRELFSLFRSSACGAEQGRNDIHADGPRPGNRRPRTPWRGGQRGSRMSKMLSIIDIMQDGPLIPVLTIDDPAHGVPLARALVAGGIRVLEITLRTAGALDAAAAIAAQVEGAIVGVGTVTHKEEFMQARGAGAVFAVSPGLTPDLAAGARGAGMPLLPGVMTPSDIIAARAAGFHELKLFPAQVCGGVGMLKALAGPFPDVTFCPTGGITLENAKDFLALPNVRCVGGSWVAPAGAVAAGDWDRITELAKAAVLALKHH